MEIHFLPREAATERQSATGTTNPLSRLTARQLEIARLLLEGNANKVIARKLGISPNTVKVHVHAIFRELRVSNRMGLVVALRPFLFGRDLPEFDKHEYPCDEPPIFFRRTMNG
jgi:DNA-binding NarL/FixJ family response regulator